MRSLGFTFILALAAVIGCGLSMWQWQKGNFDTVFGAPPTPPGRGLYTGFTANEVKHIEITTNRTHASFSLGENGWQASMPWVDRMDPRSAVGIINFTLGLRVEDSARLDKVDPRKTGLNESAIGIRLEDANHRPLAKYKLGRVTTWLADIEGMEEPVPTVFVQPHDKSRKRHVYICAGDITSMFKDELGFLRDHRPFYFNPVTLAKIRIRSQQGDLTLGRESPESAWRIVKPLDLPTDPLAIKALLEGIYELQATKVLDRSAVTLPPNENAVNVSQIAIVPFGSETETLLDVFPPESPESPDARATVSDRPDTVFDLPVKPEPGLISLADLPLSVNDLRDPTLTHLNPQSLKGISIEPSTGSTITLSREAGRKWMVELPDGGQAANEENLYALLKAVTTTRAIGFESDAATDFTSWGLDRPILKLRFLGQDNQALELRFGIDSEGGVFVNRVGTPTVMRVDASLLQAIAVHPYEWRSSLLWSVNRVYLLAIKRRQDNEPPLILKYNYNNEAWQAELDGKDLTPSLDPGRANYLLGILEGLKISRWLSPADESAAAVLKSPSLSFTVTELTTDSDGETTGVLDRKVSFAPADPVLYPGLYCGRLEGEPCPFLINRGTYQKLTATLFEN